MKRVTGIVGGIGAGKSVVSRIVRAMGFPVYDTDSQAKIIMDFDKKIHSELCLKIHPEAVKEGNIDRKLIAEVVFADSERLALLNSIVHRHVLAHLSQWIDSQNGTRCFVETAIPRSSHLDEMLTDAWLIEATDAVRIARVKSRNGLSKAQIMARLQSQSGEFVKLACPVKVITNDPDTPLLPQINNLIY